MMLLARRSPKSTVCTVRGAPSLVTVAVLAVAGLCAAPAAAQQYKVEQPDGSVLYTDRPPVTGNARVTPLRGIATQPLPAESGLPPALRAVAARYPVALYTAAGCTACDAGRRLLQQRGIPYRERRIVTEDDAAALERLVGGRTVPAVTIGAQPLRGLAEADWHAFLDAAGYPRTSQLPPGWPSAEATPLTAGAPSDAAIAPAVSPAVSPAPRSAPPPAAATAPPRAGATAPSAVRF